MPKHLGIWLRTDPKVILYKHWLCRSISKVTEDRQKSVFVWTLIMSKQWLCDRGQTSKYLYLNMDYAQREQTSKCFCLNVDYVQTMLMRLMTDWKVFLSDTLSKFKSIHFNWLCPNNGYVTEDRLKSVFFFFEHLLCQNKGLCDRGHTMSEQLWCS
jgi:hypothetical protein